MSDTHVCSGCDSTFTLRGYQSHLSQTQDPLCCAVFDRLKKSYETYQLFEQASDLSNEDEDYGQELFGQDLDANNDIDMELDAAAENRDLEEVSDNEVDDSELEDMVAELETGWEPPREGAPREDAGGDNSIDIHSDMDASNLDEERSDSNNLPPQRNFDRYIIGDGYGVKPAARILYTDKYPSSCAGKPLSHEESRDCSYRALLGGDNPWAPFHSKKDWETARWAKLRGAGSTAFSELLAIDGVSYSQSSFAVKTQILKVCDALNLSYKNSDELNKIIDNKLPGRPQFKRCEIVQSGEAVELFSRDILECIRALWGDPEFSEDLILEPERLYADEDLTIRIFHDMNTGKWWWETQVCI
jgi:Plavaka transposase